MNVEKLRKLKAYILKEPRRYRQSAWFFDEDSREFQEQNPPCGTMGCLAGNACMMEGYEPVVGRNLVWLVRLRKDALAKVDRVDEMATKILGLDGTEAYKLFDPDGGGWSKKAYKAYQSATSPKGRAKAAAMELDRLIELAERKSR